MAAANTQMPSDYPVVKSVASAGQKRKTPQSFVTKNVRVKKAKSESIFCQNSPVISKLVRNFSTNVSTINCSERETLEKTSQHSGDPSSSFVSKRTSYDSFMVHKTANNGAQVQTTACSTSSAYSTEVAASSLQTGSTDTGFPGETSLDRNASEDSSSAKKDDSQHEGLLQNHLPTHLEVNYSSCQQYDDEFSQVSNQTQHLLQTRNLKPYYTCQQCDMKFSTLRGYKQHMLVHTVPEFYTCQHCGVKFGLLRYLEEHTLKHQKHLHACKHCGATFPTRSYLRQHKVLHTGQKPYACKYCDAKYAWRQYLKLHMFLHTGQKPFVCKQCDVRFLQYSSLETHMLSHAIILDP